MITRDAEEAMVAASIPRKAEVRRDSVTLDVAYDGEPQPVLIENTTVYYMVNTPYDVFLVNGRYYACHEGIWFEAGGPNGPWLVADAIPSALYTIPPSSPKHNVTYVRVYDSTPSTVVVGYTSGYDGMYVARGVVMLGLGIWAWNEMWDHHHYHYHHYHYHPHYYGYGGGTWYDPHSGHYRREAQAYGPYGSAHGAARYDPHTGAWARGASASGYYGSRGFAEGYNPRTDTYAATRQGSNPYSSWGQGVVSRGDDWARTARYTDANGTRRAFETSEGTRGVTRRGPDGTAGAVRKDGDLYLGRDGEVYKRNENGGWQKHGGDGNWNDVERPSRDRQSTASKNRGSRDAAGSRESARRAEAEPRQRETTERARTQDRASAQPRTDSGTRRSTPERADSRSRDTASRTGGSTSRSRLNQGASSDRVMRDLARDASARQRGNSQTARRSSARAASSGRGGRRGR